MAQAAKSQEPSMEEILASIRRIIADDDSEKSAQRPAETAGGELNPDATPASPEAERAMEEPRSPSPPESPAGRIGARSGPAKAARSSTVLDLTDPMASSPSRSAAPAVDSSLASSPSRSAAPAVDSSLASAPPAPIDQAEANEAVSVTQSGGTQDDQRGGGLMSSTTSAAVDSAFNALAQTVLVHNARTLEDLVREMLRPMLKVWLDDNLPGMVERLVRAEIERVSRGRG
jgi:cell pole-organizing protein PopZ